jgi:chromate reductase, NAD(P)H dehydrogenase (quinone)
MNQPLKILGIAGSLRKQSYNRWALKAAQGLAPEGAVLETFDLDGIPAYNEDEEGSPPSPVIALKAAVRAADAVLLVTPEYNYSIPGVLKNAIDWASRPYGDSAWEGKPAAIMGASIGVMGSSRAQYHLRQCCVFLNMYTVNRPEVMIANAASKFDSEGKLTDDRTREQIRKLLQALVDWTKRLG